MNVQAQRDELVRITQEDRTLYFECYKSDHHAEMFCGYNPEVSEYHLVIPSTVTGANGDVYTVTDITDVGANLVSIVFPDHLTIIREGLCKSNAITSVVIPATVVTIEKEAFQHCYQLSSITMSAGLKTIGQSAFAGAAITSLVVPTTVDSIGSNAFNCANLSSLTVGGELKEIASGVFNTPNLTTLDIKEGVETIGASAFANSKLNNVSLPNSLKEIGNFAFAGCSQLTSLSLGNQLQTIGNSAFSGCSDLVIGNLPDSITYIGDHAFASCNKLTSELSFGNNITYIGIDAFGNLPITSLYLPDGVTVGTGAFAGCSQIETLNVAVSSINKTDFSTKNVKTLVLREGVITIENAAFSESTSLTSVSLPNSLRTIGNFAFANTIFEEANLSGVTSIGQGAFSRNKSLKKAILSNDLETLGAEAFYDCTSLETVALGKNITSIGDNTFNHCSRITTVNVPASVKSIGQAAFIGTSLTSIVLGEGVESIGQKAFAYCNALTNIVSYATTAPALGTDVFEGVPSNASVKVPCSALSSYQSNWSHFNNITTMSPVYAESEDEAKGLVTITYAGDCNNPITMLVATPNSGYQFRQWSDGNTDNPRTITSAEELNLIAYFDMAEGIENIIVNGANNSNKVLIDGNLYILHPDGNIFNAQGVRVK